MHFMKRVARYFVASLLKAGLFVLPVAVAFVYMTGSPARLEAIIKNAGVYQSFVPAVIDESLAQTQDANGKAFLQDPQVQMIAQRAFTPAELERITTTILGAAYSWLDGTNSSLQYAIDVAPQRTVLQRQLEQYAQARLESLPACTIAQIRTFDQSQNILQIPCLPPSIAPATAAAEFSRSVLQSTNFLESTTLTDETLPKGADGQRLTDRFSWLPNAYSLALWSQWAIGIAVVFLAVLFVYSSRPRHQNVRYVGWTLIGVGFVAIASVAAYVFIFSHIDRGLTDVRNVAFRDSLTQAISSFAFAYNKIIGLFAGAYIVIGIILVIISRRFKDAEPQTTDQTSTQSVQDEHTSAESANLLSKKAEIRARQYFHASICEKIQFTAHFNKCALELPKLTCYLHKNMLP